MSEATRPCPVCPHHCAPAEGAAGLCRARVAQGGQVVGASYGHITSMALDPIEKKPLARFHPGSTILSVGSYGCNLRCPFCQNHEIAQCAAPTAPVFPPDLLAQRALALKGEGNIGLAFTYNEPAVGYEYVRDAAGAAHALGLQNVMVTNGHFCREVFDALAEHIDAWNIDLKCFSEKGYQSLGGALAPVQENIRRAAETAHVEVTTLVVPGLSDSEADMAAEAWWLASISPDIPLHITRYFPRWQATAPPTPRKTLDALVRVAQKHLSTVLCGNC
ncbi:MAG: radical SAM protein [Oscillospiraceae bacterium]